jgi:hypothetical protein
MSLPIRPDVTPADGAPMPPPEPPSPPDRTLIDALRCHLQAHTAIVIKRFDLLNSAYCCNNSCKHNLVLSDQKFLKQLSHTHK